MKRHIFLRSPRASTLLEYAFIIGTVSVFLFAMNTYAKRGLQSKVRDMSDHFISEGRTWHEGKTDDYVDTYSAANTSSNAQIVSRKDLDQTTHLAYLDNSTINANSRSEDWSGGASAGNEFQSANRGRIDTPHYPSNGTIGNRTDESKMRVRNCIDLASDIRKKETQRDGYRNQTRAETYAGNKVYGGGQSAMNRASSVDCDGNRRCRARRREAYYTGLGVRNSAAQYYNNATTNSDRASALDAEIAELKEQYEAQGCSDI